MPIKITGWIFVVTAVVVLLVFAVLRLNLMNQDPALANSFDIRYLQHPVVALLHLLPGLVFLTFAPLQFVPAIRRRSIRLHRYLGRVLAVCALLTGIFGLQAGLSMPAFGGISTLAATLFFGIIFLFALGKAVWHIRHKRVAPHREWMIRTFALALGAATIRLFVLFFELAGYSMEQSFGSAFWLGFGSNLLVAEIWINYTRTATRQPLSFDPTTKVAATTAD